MKNMTDHEVERALGYTPCVCGVLSGTWHSECYRGKSKAQVEAGYKRAFAEARRYLHEKASGLSAQSATVKTI